MTRVLSAIKKKKIVLFSVIPLLLLLIFILSRVELRGEYEGIYLLKGETLLTFKITDDVLFGEQHKLLFSADLQPHSSFFSIPKSYAEVHSSLMYDWHEETGRGYVTEKYPNGTKLVTCFGRYIGSSGEAPAGLLVGGDLPFSLRKDGKFNPNVSGMTYFDGRRWNHVWCSVNESLLLSAHGLPEVNMPPSRWKFVGSEVLKATDKELVITSSHEIRENDITLKMDRYVFFKAGDTHFVLAVKITNIGRTTARYTYVYGDEPWIGNYGSSAGDVGWVEDRIINRQGAIDLNKYHYAGMFDYGNDLLQEGHGFSKTASFIEWLGDEKPESVFFSNINGNISAGGNSPLSSETRFIGLQWRKHSLRSEKSNTFIMAIGMAGINARNDLPIKPTVNFSKTDLATFVK